MKKAVKVVKLSMTDMGLSTKAAKHLTEKKIKQHVHQKNYAAKLVGVQLC